MAGRPELEHTGGKVLIVQSICMVMAANILARPSITLPRRHKGGTAGHRESLSPELTVRISLKFRSARE